MSATARLFVHLAPAPRKVWRNLLLLSADSSPNVRHNSTTHKIVRVNGRKTPSESRRLASQAPPPSSSPPTKPATPPSSPPTLSATYAPPPPPPQPPNSSNRWVAIIGSLGLVGSALGYYYYNDIKEELQSKEKPKEPKIPWESNIPKDHSSKVNKYCNLVDRIVRNGLMTDLFAVEDGARGLHAKSLYSLFKNLGLPRSTLSSYMERASKASLETSYMIWIEPTVVRVPAKIEDLPESVQYLLVGGGTASFAAFRAIKSNQPKAQILVISEEDLLPYMRPPLSKEIWRNTELPELDELSFQQWNGNRRSLYYESGAFYADVTTLSTLENGGVSVARGYTVTRVDPVRHEATVTAPGQPDRLIKYGKCLIATGVRPKNIDVLAETAAAVQERCVLLRTARDAAKLWNKLDSAEDVVLVGGGFLGSEMAYALAAATQERGKQTRVTQVFREAGNLAHILPEYLARWTTRQLEKLGVKILSNTEIKTAYMKGDRVALELTNGGTLEADVIVVGAGSIPNTEIAGVSGLETHPQLGGLLVNAELQARTDLYAAGDVACFYDAALGRRRVEHHDHAVVSGRLAGENMAGAAPPKHYVHQSMFWSDLGPDIGLEAIGVIDSTLPTVAVFAERPVPAQPAGSNEKAATDENAASSEESSPPGAGKAALVVDPEDKKYEKGVVFYLDGKRIVGVLMWNLFNRMSIARQLLLQGEEYEDLNEVAKLFHLHKESE